MAQITPSMIKELRERTQAGMSDCKSALVEADGDLDKAVEVILKKGIVKAASRAGRVATEGEIGTRVSSDKKRAVIVEINCQTDFVARGDDFRGFVRDALDIIEKMPHGSDLATQVLGPQGKSVDTVRQELIAKTGENIVIRRWETLLAPEPGAMVHAYVHMGGKLAVLLHATAPSETAAKSQEFQTFADNLAMQVAAMNPLVTDKAKISAHDIAKQKEIFTAQLKEEGKPEAAWPKILEGKIAKWFTEVTLLGQESVIEPGRSINAIRDELGKTLGGDIVIRGFIRFALGDGIEKKSDDLAAEVAKLM